MNGTNFEIRPAKSDEMDAFRNIGNYVFANNAENANAEPSPLMPEWTLAAFDGSKLVSSSGYFPFKMRWNGCAVAAQGVTAVGTDPTYRRRGIVRRLITGLLEQANEQGVPVSILWASMGAIYQRFGYGLATNSVGYTVDRREIKFQVEQAVHGTTSLTPTEEDESMETIGAIYRQFGAHRHAMLHRDPVYWSIMVRRNADANIYAAIHRDEDGTPSAYCLYSTKFDGEHQRMTVFDFAWLNMNGYRAIWEYIKAHDLVRTVDMAHVPDDDPALTLFEEPRALGKKVMDGIWLRVVNAEQAIAARGYDFDGEVVMRLSKDEQCPWNEGLLQLSASSDGEVAVRKLSSGTPDIELTPNGLATLLSGYATASTLHDGGRIEVADPGKLRQFDALFSTRYRPHCPNSF